MVLHSSMPVCHFSLHYMKTSFTPLYNSFCVILLCDDSQRVTFSVEYYQFLGFRCLVLSLACQAHTIQIYSRLQPAAAVGGEIPVVCECCRLSQSVLRMIPQQSAADVKHFDGHLHVAAASVVADDERSVRLCRIVGAIDVGDVRSQTFHHVEFQRRCRRVVEDIPCGESVSYTNLTLPTNNSV